MQLQQPPAGLGEAVAAFAGPAKAAGVDTAVPTTPDWDVRRLVAHQGLVHRWATGHLLGRQVDPDATEHEGLTAEDPVDWLRTGAGRLVTALEEASDELEALVFLADAPTPKRFWAR